MGKFLFFAVMVFFVVRRLNNMVESVGGPSKAPKRKRARGSRWSRSDSDQKLRPEPRVVKVESPTPPASSPKPPNPPPLPASEADLPWLPADLGRSDPGQSRAPFEPPQKEAAPVPPAPVPDAPIPDASWSRPASQPDSKLGSSRSVHGKPALGASSESTQARASDVPADGDLEDGALAKLADAVREALSRAGLPDPKAPVRYSISSSLVRPTSDLATALLGLAGKRASGRTGLWRDFARATRLFGLTPADAVRLDAARIGSALERLSGAAPALRGPVVRSLVALASGAAGPAQKELVDRLIALDPGGEADQGPG